MHYRPLNPLIGLTRTIITDVQNDNDRLRAATAQGSLATLPQCNHPKRLANALSASWHQNIQQSLLAVAALPKAPVTVPPPLAPSPVIPVVATSTGIKQYSAPIFDKYFSGNQYDWESWKKSALMWARTNEAVIPCSQQGVTWFSNLLSSSAHSVAIALAVTATSGPATAANIASHLDEAYADPKATEKHLRHFEELRQGQHAFCVFWLAFQAASSEIMPALATSELRCRLLSAIRPGLWDKLKAHYFDKFPALSESSLTQTTAAAHHFDPLCLDTGCVPNTCPASTTSFVCPQGKGKDCKCGPAGTAARSTSCISPFEYKKCGCRKNLPGHKPGCKHGRAAVVTTATTTPDSSAPTVRAAALTTERLATRKKEREAKGEKWLSPEEYRKEREELW